MRIRAVANGNPGEPAMTKSPSSYGNRQSAVVQFSRVFEAAGCTTQNELAKVLQIRQSSISDAKKRGSVPADWLVKLLRLRGINPDWILLGTEPKFLTPGADSKDEYFIYETVPPVRPGDALIVRKMLRCFPVRALISELRRRKHAREEES